MLTMIYSIALTGGFAARWKRLEGRTARTANIRAEGAPAGLPAAHPVDRPVFGWQTSLTSPSVSGAAWASLQSDGSFDE
jgi:hypothetical protein